MEQKSNELAAKRSKFVTGNFSAFFATGNFTPAFTLSSFELRHTPTGGDRALPRIKRSALLHCSYTTLMGGV